MKRSPALLILLLCFLVAGAGVFFAPQFTLNEFRTFYKKKKLSKETKAAFSRARFLYEYDMLKDPGTGRLPANIRRQEYQLARSVESRHRDIGSGVQGTDNLNTYIAAGPDSIGGRTRTVAYDIRYNNSSNRIILSGSVSGGIFRSTDGGANWNRVSPENDIHNLSSLVQDPRPGFQDTWYAGGGEPVGNSTSEDGAPYHSQGILKSTDNGVTWQRLNTNFTEGGNQYGSGTLEVFDHPFDYIHKIEINPVNGHVYVAGHRRLLRSTDGGNNWTVVFSGSSAAGSSTGQMDIECSSTGRLYLAVNGGFREHALRGIWTSTTGSADSWTRIAGGRTANDSVPGWRGNSYNVLSTNPDTSFKAKRIILALAPSNENVLYALYENGLSHDAPDVEPEADLFKLVVSPNSRTWTNLSDNMPDFPGQMSGVDPLALQEGYNLMLAVKPDNENVVFVGGTNLFRSTDGFTTTTKTAWIGGYNQDFASGLKIYPSSHPDFHTMAFMPNNNGINLNYLKAIVGNDGGLQTTDNIMSEATSYAVKWNMVKNYQTLQYYHVGIGPTANRNYFIGGAQDNGTQVRLNNTSGHERIISGDGGSAAIGTFNNINDFAIYGSSQLGSIYRMVPGTFTELTPSSGLTKYPGLEEAYGDFITYFKANPDNPEDIYYANFNRLFRTTKASTMGRSEWTELTGVRSKTNPFNSGSATNVSIRAMETTRGPYSPAHVLYIGTSSGKVLRLNDPRNAAPNTSPVDITPPELQNLLDNGRGVNVNDIAVNPNNDNEILVVVSNYSVTMPNNTTRNDINIWWTNNAKSSAPTWRLVEGNLTLPSVRSCQIVVKKEGNASVTEYYVGTSVGLYSTLNIAQAVQGGNPINWVREGGNILNFAVITSLDYRPVDNVLLVGTHGNGMYYAAIGNPDYRPDQTTGLPDPVRNDENFIRSAYPAIAKNTLTYQVGNMFTIRKIQLRVHNLAGQTLINREAGYQHGQLDVSQLSKGVYILTITSADYTQQYVRRFIKE